jgi:nitrogen fixation protein NifU and related proteins
MERTALESVYQEVILKHYRRSTHRGELEAPDVVVPMRNPTCGDDILLQMNVRDGVVEAVRFTGHGCAISQAAASMMAEHAEGKAFADIHPLAERFRQMVQGDADAARDRALGEMRALAGVAKLPNRVKCAMLAWDALEEGRKRLAGEPSGE